MVAFFTYIVASQKNGTIYTGSTDDLVQRISQHRAKTFKGFTARHDVDKLVWFEMHSTRDAAFKRERQIKKWKRIWKLELIEKANPGWRDLYDDVRRGGLSDPEDWKPPEDPK